MNTMTERKVSEEIMLPGEADALAEARRLLIDLTNRVGVLSYDPRVKAGYLSEPNPFDCGIIYETYRQAADAIFDALNATRSYGHAPITTEQMSGRRV